MAIRALLVLTVAVAAPLATSLVRNPLLLLFVAGAWSILVYMIIQIIIIIIIIIICYPLMHEEGYNSV